VFVTYGNGSLLFKKGAKAARNEQKSGIYILFQPALQSCPSLNRKSIQWIFNEIVIFNCPSSSISYKKKQWKGYRWKS
jgi:hypothetical protein